MFSPICAAVLFGGNYTLQGARTLEVPHVHDSSHVFRFPEGELSDGLGSLIMTSPAKGKFDLSVSKF